MTAGRKQRLGILLVAALATPAPVLAQTAAAFKTGGWSGNAHFDAQKKFLSCVVFRNSPDGIEYGFRMTPQMNMQFGMSKREWNMTPSQDYTYSIELGAYKKSHSGAVTADSRNTLWINVGNDADLRRAVAAGGTINLVGGGNSRFSFSLAGGDNAMRKLLACTALFAVE